mmetsp:Transcript_39939/g.128415  ORF Transcript_39939/g.128415 Transcript_39939/m.128415 type:complete len:214 (-) Transcript_39939:551-1192(-)
MADVEVARRLRREASHHLSPLRVRQRDLERAGVLCGAEEELRGLLEGGQGLDAAPPAGDVHSRAGAGLVWRRQLAQEQPGGGVREGGGVARHEGAHAQVAGEAGEEGRRGGGGRAAGGEPLDPLVHLARGEGVARSAVRAELRWREPSKVARDCAAAAQRAGATRQVEDRVAAGGESLRVDAAEGDLLPHEPRSDDGEQRRRRRSKVQLVVFI